MLTRPLRVPWTARRSSQSIPEEISPEYSLEGLMLKLQLQYFGYLVGITESLKNKNKNKTKQKKNSDTGKSRRQEEKGTTGD